MTNRLDQQIQFILEIDNLKSISRQSYLLNGTRYENSAEHSWHIALMAVVLAEHSQQPIDLLRVLKMLLVHDVVEIDAGDTYCYDETEMADKATREQRAAQRLFGLLPPGQETELRALWEEFEAAATPSAKFANAVDRLMPLFHNYYTQGKSWQQHGIKKSQVMTRLRPIAEGSEALWQVAHTIVEESVKRGYLAADDD